MRCLYTSPERSNAIRSISTLFTYFARSCSVFAIDRRVATLATLSLVTIASPHRLQRLHQAATTSSFCFGTRPRSTHPHRVRDCWRHVTSTSVSKLNKLLFAAISRLWATLGLLVLLTHAERHRSRSLLLHFSWNRLASCSCFAHAARTNGRRPRTYSHTYVSNVRKCVSSSWSQLPPSLNYLNTDNSCSRPCNAEEKLTRPMHLLLNPRLTRPSHSSPNSAKCISHDLCLLSFVSGVTCLSCCDVIVLCKQPFSCCNPDFAK